MTYITAEMEQFLRKFVVTEHLADFTL